jgi:hypothetical protein
VVLNLPDDIDGRNVDLATELQILGFHLQQTMHSAGDESAAS